MHIFYRNYGNFFLEIKIEHEYENFTSNEFWEIFRVYFSLEKLLRKGHPLLHGKALKGRKTERTQLMEC